MLARYLVPQGAITKQESTRRSDKTVNTSKGSKERTFHAQMSEESSYIVLQKNIYLTIVL